MPHSKNTFSKMGSQVTVVTANHLFGINEERKMVIPLTMSCVGTWSVDSTTRKFKKDVYRDSVSNSTRKVCLCFECYVHKKVSSRLYLSLHLLNQKLPCNHSFSCNAAAINIEQEREHRTKQTRPFVDYCHRNNGFLFFQENCERTGDDRNADGGAQSLEAKV